MRQAKERFDKWKELAGIRPQITILSFRAGFATELYRATQDLLLVSHALGHKYVRTTEKYITIAPVRIRRVMEAAFPK